MKTVGEFMGSAIAEMEHEFGALLIKRNLPLVREFILTCALNLERDGIERIITDLAMKMSNDFEVSSWGLYEAREKAQQDCQTLHAILKK
jgi:hypothetical protein